MLFGGSWLGISDSPSEWLWPKGDGQPVGLAALGQVLRGYRKGNRLTQAGLGELLQVDQTYISLIERGSGRSGM